MSLRNHLVLPIILSTIAALAGCGSSSHHVVPPPTGSFSDSDLNGSYVFSTVGTDVNQAPISIVGSFTADGKGGISAGTVDFNDPSVSPPFLSFSAVTSGNYNVTADGRGQATISVTTLGPVKLDFVLISSSHGLITEFDGNGTGSGTLDVQTTITQSQLQDYAYSFSGYDVNSFNPMSAAGAFSLGGSTTITSGVQDINDFGLHYFTNPLSGSVTLGSGGTTGTAVLSGPFGSLSFDFYVIDANHLKFIEVDTAEILSGDAFSQTTASIPAGTYAFTLSGLAPPNTTTLQPVAAGGLLVSDGNGTITDASSEDVNDGGTSSSAPLAVSGQYVFSGPRAVVTLSGMFPGSTFAAYPSSGGLLLLELDNGGVTSGAAFPQTSTTLADTQGYGLNLTGVNLFDGVEVDDIAEFTAAAVSSNPNMTGLIDENFAPGGSPTFDTTLSGTYAPNTTGRYTANVNAGDTLNGGFGLNVYPVDGSNFIFMEGDNSGQVAVGSFAVQTPTSVTGDVLRHPMMIMPKPSIHGAWKKRMKTK